MSLICSLCIISCGDDLDLPDYLALHVENCLHYNGMNQIAVVSPFEEEFLVSVFGGDEDYEVTCEDSRVELIKKDQYSYLARIEHLGNDTVTIHIKDHSQLYTRLFITMKYPVITYKVSKYLAVIEGENITVGDKKKMEEEIQRFLSEKMDGKYVFTYTNKELSGGLVRIESGKTVEEGTFSSIPMQAGDVSYSQITIQTDKETCVYDFRTDVYTNQDFYLSTRFVEDVTDKYKEKYPGFEKAYAIQGVWKTTSDY